ncbi:hypothetical protein C8R44DRAFT_974085 [Mycena epipterygia]|nr:hypothetical protein C8R44DRAFT_974085 [Mycena epipterygia]
MSWIATVQVRICAFICLFEPPSPLPLPPSLSSTLWFSARTHMPRLFYLPLILVALNVFAETARGVSLRPRQGITTNAACATACTPFNNAVAVDGSNIAALCTAAVVNFGAACADCLVSSGGTTKAVAQETVDGYISECASAGFPLSDPKISGAQKRVDVRLSGVSLMWTLPFLSFLFTLTFMLRNLGL